MEGPLPVQLHTEMAEKDKLHFKGPSQRLRSRSGTLIIDFSFPLQRRKLKGTGKEGERVRVSGEGKQMSASLGASSSPQIRLITGWWSLWMQNRHLVSPLLFLCSSQDVGDRTPPGMKQRGVKQTAGRAEGGGQERIPPCLHPVWRRRCLPFCTSGPGPGGRQQSLLRS